jgi:nitrogen fixation protein FixH
MENVTVENGYKLHIQFLGSTLVGPEAEVNPEIVIEPINSQLVYGNPLVFEVAESDLTLFCDASSNKYMANMPQSLNKTIANIIDTSNSALLNIKAYPNPSSNELNVVIDNENESITQIEIFDAIGNSVIKIESQENSIHKLENACLVNTRNLKDGIYIIRVRSSNGRIGSAKILIQN